MSNNGHGVVLSQVEREKLEREARAAQEQAAGQAIQVLLHPGAGLVELQVREKFDLRPRSVFVPVLTWEVVFGSLLQMRLQAAGVTSELTRKV